MVNIPRATQAIKDEIAKPIPEHHLSKREMKDMSEENEETTTTSKPKRATKKTASKKTVAKKTSAKKTAPASTANTDVVTLEDLAKEASISGASARLKLRAADVSKAGRKWEWPAKSRDLKAARKALGLS